ncbi:MAG: hypothetical protein RJA87_1438 [Pseudomonadota bacterium]
MKTTKDDALADAHSNTGYQALGDVSGVVAEAANRTRAVLDASVKAFQSESAEFLDEFSSQSEEALEQMARCKSPLEVIAVQQGWMQARSLAYLQSGLRFARTLATASTVRTKKTEPRRPMASSRSDGAQQEARH